MTANSDDTPSHTGATPFPGTSEMAALMRAFDWPSTGLPPADHWPESLRAVTRILLTSRFAMWMGWGPDLRFLYNDAYARMTLGAKHPWALGKRADEVWAEIWKDLYPRVRTVLETGQATWDESLLLFLQRSGYPEETYHTFSYSPVFSDDGKIAGMFCVVTEETERVIGERRLSTLRELATALAAAVKEEEVFTAINRALATNPQDLPFSATYLFDDAGEKANHVASTGFTNEYDPVRPIIDLVNDDDAERVRELRRSGKGYVVGGLQARFPSLPRGAWEQPPTNAYVVPITQAASDRPAGILVAGLNRHRPFDASYESFLDLVAGQIAASLANARAYESERRRAESLAELDRAKTTFFSNVSHELRTPLTLMLGPAEDVLLDPATREQNRVRAGLIHRNALRLLKLVNTMLDFSRIEAGRMQASFEPTDFAALVSEIASTFRSAIERAGVRFTVHAPHADEQVYLDRDLWEKIVLNLLSNAFKHTFEGEIAVSAEVKDGEATLTVRDSGVGIAPDELPRIFERFHRVPNARSRTHEGTGIGLALVQELVKLHGGRMLVSSEVGKGTTFGVMLPTGSSHLPREHVVGPDRVAVRSDGAKSSAAFVEEALRWLPSDDGAANERRADAAAKGDRARIVVVDDNADMRDYLARLLREAGHDVFVATDGKSALSITKTAPPDVILSDVMMPGLDGFGLLAALRDDPRTIDVPVILLSARAGEEARVEGMRAGATDYLVKPFSARELMARVDSHVARARAMARERRDFHAREGELRMVSAERERLHELLAQAPAAIAILSGSDLVYEIANDEYLRMVGGRQILGKPIREALPELAGQGIYELLETVRRTGQPALGRELRVTMSDRDDDDTLRERYFNFVYQPVREEDDSVSGVFVHAVDVTDQVLARREAEAANRAKSEFLAAMSHELRTPLNAIAGYAQLIEIGVHGPITEAQRDALHRLQRSEQHLLALVNDVLNFAKLEAGRVAYELETVRVAPLLDSVRMMVEGQIAARGLRCSTSADPSLEACADPEKVSQILINLLSNATKFTEPGGSIAVSASMRDGDGKGWIDIAVTDTGIGIPADRQASVFDPFVQVHRRLTHTTEGTGLGLAISRDLARGMSGDLTVSSAEGKGSTFTLSLPEA